MTRSRSHFEEQEPFLEKILQYNRFRKVEPYIKNGIKLLDLGCGFKGGLLKRVSNKISEGTGYDLSVSKHKISNNINLFAKRFDKKLKLQPNHFDVITSLAVLEHLSDPQMLLNQVFKSLKKGGYLILTTPSPASKYVLEFLAYKIHIVSGEEIRDHKNYFNHSDLKNMLAKAGFGIRNIKIHTFELGLNNLAVAKK